MASVTPYLFFDGTCAEAMRFYERTLGGRMEGMFRAGDTPGGGIPPEQADRIMHAHLVVGDRAILASDWMAPGPYPGMNGFSLSLHPATVEEGRRLFDALAEGGTVNMPFEKTFWAEAFGMLVDRFGTPWMVNVDAPRP